MKISDIVRHKGDSVVTVRSDATVKDLLALLAEHKIGAIVVSDSDGSVDGIVSERDVVRHLHQRGAAVPVVNDGKLAAIVSIGDVVKSRIDTLQAEAAQLRDYIQG